jgi:lysozyme
MKAPGPLYIVAAATLAAGAYIWWSNSQAIADDGTDDGDGTDSSGLFDFSGITTMFAPVTNALDNASTDPTTAVGDPNVQAFLAMIRMSETGTDGPSSYTTLYGGGHFSDMSKFPDIKVTAGGYTSTAAGGYQFIDTTWYPLAAEYGLTDFEPATQDLAAVIRIKARGALANVLAGNVSAAMQQCSNEWASLPGSPYGQPVHTVAQEASWYADAGGAINDGTATV